MAGGRGCLTGGLLTDWFIRKTGNRRWGRRLFGILGHSLTATCFLLCLLAPTATWFFLAISLAGFSTDLAMGPLGPSVRTSANVTPPSWPA